MFSTGSPTCSRIFPLPGFRCGRRTPYPDGRVLRIFPPSGHGSAAVPQFRRGRVPAKSPGRSSGTSGRDFGPGLPALFGPARKRTETERCRTPALSACLRNPKDCPFLRSVRSRVLKQDAHGNGGNDFRPSPDKARKAPAQKGRTKARNTRRAARGTGVSVFHAPPRIGGTGAQAELGRTPPRKRMKFRIFNITSPN